MTANTSPKPIRKHLGAYYTPQPYCSLAQKLLLAAISQLPAGCDYIVIDRCAGTGNMERGLPDDVLSHCILSTYEKEEHDALFAEFGGKVRLVMSADVDTLSDSGFYENLNAMSREFVEDERIRAYVDNPECAVILYENPPYRDSAEDNWFSGKGTAGAFVLDELRSALPSLPNSNDSTARDIVNQFVWSAYEYYLKGENDSYIVIAPLKYWKTLGLSDRKFADGYLMNRKHFNATLSAVGCVRWCNVPNASDSITLPSYDIDRDGNLEYVRDTTVRKCRSTLTDYFDRETREGDVETSVFCEANGKPTNNAMRKCDGKSWYNDDIVGYMRPTSFALGNKHINLVRTTIYNSRGFYLRKCNFFELLPLFAAKRYPQRKWYDYDVFYTTSDGGTAYQNDEDFLRACLIFTCLSMHNKCLSFRGEDGRTYLNELCLDAGTVARKKLDSLTLTEREKKLVEKFDALMELARECDGYDDGIKYGPYQIDMNLNVLGKDARGRRTCGTPELDEMLRGLKADVEAYYDDVIAPKLFEYELLK